MKKTHMTLVMMLVFLFVFGMFPHLLWAQPNPWDSDPHKTGLKELTPEELLIIERNQPRVKNVKLNKLGLDRVNSTRRNKGLSQLSPQVTVKDGQEIETTVGSIPGATTSTAGTTSTTMTVLPDMIDNSQLKYFPPIRSQGSINSCGAFSGVYYAMTYMIAMARDWDAKSGGDTYRLSPKWVYDMVDGGSDSGSWYYWAYDMGIKHGISTWSEFPYDSDYRAWSMSADVWKASIYRRFDKYGYVANTNTDTGIAQVKQMLLDGYVLNIPTYINSWQYKTFKDDPTTTLDDPYVGKSVCYWVNGKNGYHAMTVVGYNDNVWVDINGNGVVDPGEKGAFRIANSWGTGWGDGGFAWMAYDALKNPSAVTGGPSTGRITGWSPTNAHWVLARSAYTPLLLGEFTLNHLKRNQLYLTLGVSDTLHNSPTTTWVPYAVTYDGGAYAFNGTTTAVDDTFVMDFTDIAPSTSGLKRFYLGVMDSTAGDPVQIKSFKLIDVANGGREGLSTSVPLTADGAQVYVSVDYDYNNGNFAPTAVATANPVSGYVPTTVSFDGSGSYDTDGTVASYSWTFGDGLTGTGAAVSHNYTVAGNYTASLTVTDNLGATGVQNLAISIAPDPTTLVAPSNLTASVSATMVTLDWLDNSTNEDGFYIERALKAKGTSLQFQRIGQTMAGVSTYGDVVANGTYVYRVQAFSVLLGKVSSYSNSVTVKVGGGAPAKK